MNEEKPEGVPLQPPPPPPPEKKAPEEEAKPKSDPGRRQQVKDDRYGMIVDRRPSESITRNAAIVIA